jgi:NTE family protein
MFAAWEAGVWKALSDGFRPDLIVGASAGAWNGWAIAGGVSADELIAEWLDGSLAAIRIFHPEPLHQKARELFSRFRPELPFGLTVVETPGLGARLVCGPEITWRHMAATCSIPVLFPPVSIGNRRYVDGGVGGALPVWAAQEMGATRAVAMNCLMGLPFRVLRAILRPRPPRAGFPVACIIPSQPLGSLRDAICWSRPNIERWIALGERDGKRALSSITM